MSAAALYAHLKSGTTEVCRAWLVTRRDGVRIGFTDHDRDLAFDGIVFRASSGMTARALQQTTGLAVDNSEAVGALSDASVTEDDIAAGRFDGAEVRAWLVNWSDVAARVEEFRGTLGEITRVAGAFRAELRGQTELLNQPQGRVYQRACSAVLGDGSCRFDLTQPGYSIEHTISTAEAGTTFGFEGLAGFDPRWFERGRLVLLSGPASGSVGLIKNDRITETGRTIELWQSLRVAVGAGDRVRLEAGCDKQATTCRTKFTNLVNFQGFPFLPGEDWLTSYPRPEERRQAGQSLFSGTLLPLFGTTP